MGAIRLSAGIVRTPLMFDLVVVSGVEQETDEFSLPVGSGLLENARKMGFSGRGGDAVPPRGGRAAVPFTISAASLASAAVRPKRRRRLTSCDDRDGSSDADPGNIRKPGLGAKRRHQGRTGKLTRDFKFAAGAAKHGRGSGA